MRFEIRRDGIAVIPDSKQDEAYIEDTLGLRRDGEYVRLVRKNAFGLSCMGLLETTRVAEGGTERDLRVAQRRSATLAWKADTAFLLFGGVLAVLLVSVVSPLVAAWWSQW